MEVDGFVLSEIKKAVVRVCMSLQKKDEKAGWLTTCKASYLLHVVLESTFIITQVTESMRNEQ